MTSVTGSERAIAARSPALAPAPIGPGADGTCTRGAGFTLIELLIVISIILLLMAILGLSVGSMYRKMRIKSTMSLIQRFEVALERYHGKTGRFPHDGIDSKVVTNDGTRLQSGAALTFAMTQPLKRYKRLPTGERRLVAEEEPLLSLAGTELSDPLDEDPQAVEALDSWGNALHYDNLEGKAKYSRQDDGSFHLSEPDEHGDDPREDADFVLSVGEQNTNRFDLWSHGIAGHSAKAKVENTLCNWGAAAAKGGEQDEEDDG